MVIQVYLNKKIAVVIPTYKSSKKILNVISEIPKFVDLIVVVDDFCPENSGKLVKNATANKKIKVLFHEKNQGVGGATITGYKYLLNKKIDFIVKIDSDGQMDSKRMVELLVPLISGNSQYTKGNRFFSIESIKKMPKLRILGNGLLSFISKLSTGYWGIVDPTNGYTAIDTNLLRKIPLNKIDKRYFFESDLLFRLQLAKCRVTDIEIDAKYGDEESNLKIIRIIFPFLFAHLKNMSKRYCYEYILKEMNVATFELPIGFLLLFTGVVRGVNEWYESYQYNKIATSGNVVLTAVLILTGVQFILSFINFDSRPKY